MASLLVSFQGLWAAEATFVALGSSFMNILVMNHSTEILGKVFFTAAASVALVLGT